MRSEAGLSLGAIIPALRRLEKGGLVVRSKKASRNRREFSLTTVGRRSLKDSISSVLSSIAPEALGDTDSALRTACLALYFGKRKEAQEILRAAAENKETRLQAVENSKATLEGATLAGLYRSMTLACETARLKAERKALTTLSRRRKR